MEFPFKEYETSTKRHQLVKPGLAKHVWTEHRRIKKEPAQIINKDDHGIRRNLKELSTKHQTATLSVNLVRKSGIYGNL